MGVLPRPCRHDPAGAVPTITCNHPGLHSLAPVVLHSPPRLTAPSPTSHPKRHRFGHDRCPRRHARLRPRRHGLDGPVQPAGRHPPLPQTGPRLRDGRRQALRARWLQWRWGPWGCSEGRGIASLRMAIAGIPESPAGSKVMTEDVLDPPIGCKMLEGYLHWLVLAP